MAMPVANPEWTIDMLDALPEGAERHEIIDGELFVTPAPGEAHQLVIARLLVRLDTYLQPSRTARATFSPSDVWRDARMHNRVQPDVFVLRVTDGKRPSYPYHLRDLLLAIEVVSPGNPRLDYQGKRTLYLSEGVGEYWVVNPEARNISRWRGQDDPGDVLSERIEWRADDLDKSFELAIQEFFANALD
jgi:Uma2 family endonuclease